MALCPIRNKKRAFFARTQSALGTGATIGAADAINVIDVQLTTTEEGTIDRSDVWSAYGAGALPIMGSLGWEITVQTEVYTPRTAGSTAGWSLNALFAACPVKVAPVSGTGYIGITPYSQACIPGDITPITIEIHERNGTRYRAIDCMGTFTISGDPGGRILIDWTFTGQFVAPDNAPALTPVYQDEEPAIYKNSNYTGAFTYSGLTSPLTLPNCGAFEFDPGMESNQVQTACNEHASPLTFVGHGANCTLTINNVLTSKVTDFPLWTLAVNNVDIDSLFKVADDPENAGGTISIDMPRTRLQAPTIVEVDAFLGTNVVLSGSSDLGDDQYTILIGTATAP